jgi:hypothetical protein
MFRAMFRPTRVFWRRAAFGTAIGGIWAGCYITPTVREVLQELKQREKQQEKAIKKLREKCVLAFLLVFEKEGVIPTRDDLIDVFEKLEIPYKPEEVDKTLQAFHGSNEES